MSSNVPTAGPASATPADGPDLDANAVVLSDRSGIIRMWNPGAESIFGYPAENAIGNSLDILIPAHIRERHWVGFHRAINTGTTAYDGLVFADPVTHSDSTVHIHRGWIKLLLTTTGGVMGVISVWEPARPGDQQLNAPTVIANPGAVAP
ncbi:MAG: PAS domain S-box protein [Candidatus Dormibacteria bacterium]